MFQDDPKVLFFVCVSVYVFIRVSLYPQQGCVVREKEKKRKRERDLSGWEGAREGRMDVFDG